MKKIGTLILTIILVIICASCSGNETDPLFNGNWGAPVSLSDSGAELTDKINSLIRAEDSMTAFRLFGWDSYVLNVALKTEENDEFIEQVHIEKLKLYCSLSSGAFTASGDIKMSVSVQPDSGNPVPLYTEGKTYVKDGYHYVSTRIGNSGATIKKMFSFGSFSDIVMFEISEELPHLYSPLYFLLYGDVRGVKIYIDRGGAETKLKLEYDAGYLADNSQTVLGSAANTGDIKFRSFYTVLVWNGNGDFTGIKTVLDADVNGMVKFWDISVKHANVNIETPEDLGTYQNI